MYDSFDDAIAALNPPVEGANSAPVVGGPRPMPMPVQATPMPSVDKPDSDIMQM